VTVSRDLKFMQAEWAQDHKHDIDLIKARELAKCDLYERKAAENYARSEEDTTDEVKEQWNDEAPDADGKIQTKTRFHVRTVTEKHIASVEWSKEIRAWMELRAKILGYGNLEKVALTDPSGEKEYSGGATLEERATEIVALLNLAREREARKTADEPSCVDAAAGSAD
jgi:predicted ATP-grasp superfamily ATP-dependent carboligase